MKKFISGFSFFCAGLAVTLGLARYFLNASPDALVQFKLAQFLQNKDDYTTLILGSSHSYRNINPLLLDEILSGTGKNSKTYNLAVPGASFFETHALLEMVLAEHPKGLSLVLMDPREWHGGVGTPNWTSRDIYWHGLSQTADAVRFWARHQHVSKQEAGYQILKEIEAFALNALLWGRAAAPAFGPVTHLDSSSIRLITDNSGFMALDWEAADEFVLRNKKWINDRSRGAQPISDYYKGKLNFNDQFNYNGLGLAAQRAGAKLILHRTPAVDRGSLLNCAPPECTQFDFQDRDLYRELFDASFFFDPRHYNLEGSKHYTRALAKKILASEGRR